MNRKNRKKSPDFYAKVVQRRLSILRAIERDDDGCLVVKKSESKNNDNDNNNNTSNCDDDDDDGKNSDFNCINTGEWFVSILRKVLCLCEVLDEWPPEILLPHVFFCKIF